MKGAHTLPTRSAWTVKLAKKLCSRRDKRRCQLCGKSVRGSKKKPIKSRPRIHHKAPWAQYPELRTDVRNLVTLCVECHEWIHSDLGRMVRKQWEREALEECKGVFPNAVTDADQTNEINPDPSLAS